MSTCSSSGSSYVLEDEELLQFEARCKELRIEKDLLKQSSSELIRSLESHAKTLSATRSNDKKRIQDLERELSNCSQELGKRALLTAGVWLYCRLDSFTDYLQDQLTTRDTEINRLTDYIHSLESKVKAKEDLNETIKKLEQELKACKSENFGLMEKLENSEHELHNSTLCIDKLEESISNIALDFQCDIESMKLDLMAMENSFFEAKELQKEVDQERHRMQELTRNYKIQIQNVTRLVEENKELREKLKAFESNAKMKKLDEYEAQIHDYEVLVNQLKEQLKDEKFKANEEAEDLAQEMAELRYQLTGLLEEEYKKRASIEQRALQRITELES